MARSELDDTVLTSRVAAVFGGSVAAVVRPGGVVVLELPGLDPVAEIGLDGGPEVTEIAFLEDLPRLVVLTRGTLYVIDPSGPEKLGELALRGPAKLVAIAGRTILLGGPAPMLVDAEKRPLRASPLPLRAPLAAGARLTEGRFLIASGGAIEEWDASARAPVRRLRVERPIDPAHIGGTGQRVWMVLRSEPQAVEIISLVSRLSRRVELPEKVGRVVPQPTGDMLVAIGVRTGTAYVIDLVRDRLPMALDNGATLGAAWIDPTSVLLESAGGQVAIFTTPSLARASAPAIEVPAGDAAEQRPTHEAIGFEALPEDEPPPPFIERPGVLAPSVPELPNIGSWRTDLVAWVRGARRALPKRTRIDELVQRLELVDARFAVALLYGARLLGTNGVSAVELASVSGWDWTEALGQGRLAALPLVRRCGERWRLVEEAVAFLDDRSPIRGEIVRGTGSPPAANIALVARDPAALRAAASHLGSLFAPNEHGERDPKRFMLEARLRDLVPVVPWEQFRSHIEWPVRAAILVADPQRARELGLSIVDGRSP